MSKRTIGMLVGVAVLLVSGSAAMGAVWLDYEGYDDLGGGTYRHNYIGMRDAGDSLPVKDLHVVGQFKWDAGTISLTAPGDWNTMLYTGPSLQLYNWQINEGQVWVDGTLYGFGITVTNPAVTSTPFHWTDNPQFPNFPDLGSIVATGTTSVPTPEPATLGLLAVGAVALLRRRRK